MFIKKRYEEDNAYKLRKVVDLLRLFIFLGIYFLCLSLVITHIIFASSVNQINGVLTAGTVAIFTWFRSKLTLWGFLAAIPAISGIQNVGLISPGPTIDLLFSVIYIVWFSKRIIRKNYRVEPNTVVGWLVDLLSGIILISIITILFAYPFDYILFGIQSISFLGQDDPQWCLRGGLIVLQGIMFFRILGLEFSGTEIIQNAKKILIVHAITIFVFSLIQLTFHFPPVSKYGGIYSPFDDVHSFGSYITFLFLFFLVVSVSPSKKSPLKFILCCFLFYLIIFSTSTTTPATAVILSFAYLLGKIRKTFLLIFAGILVGFLIYVNLNVNILREIENPILKRYVQRLIYTEAQKKLSGRFKSADQAIGIIKEFPLTGSGVGTFFRSSRHYSISSTTHPNRIENAHNYYLQMAAEIGIPAAIIFLYIILSSLKKGVVQSRKFKKASDEMEGFTWGLGAYSLTMLTGHPLLLSNQQFLFWFVIASIVLAYVSPTEKLYLASKVSRSTILIASVILMLMIAGYVDKIISKKNQLRGYEYGFYGYENWDGEKVRWTWKKSTSRISAITNIFGFKVTALPMNCDGPEGLILKVMLNGKVIDEIHFFDRGSMVLYYFASDIKEKDIEIGTEVNQTFVPRRIGLNQDPRTLGVAMGPITFLKIMPLDGIGFFDYGNLQGGKDIEIIQENGTNYGWTGKRASIPINKGLEDEIVLYLKCIHPEINHSPVEVYIFCDGKMIKKKVLSDQNWQKVNIVGQEITGSEVLTFEVSRTWNPKIVGVSDLNRNIGVAVYLAGG